MVEFSTKEGTRYQNVRGALSKLQEGANNSRGRGEVSAKRTGDMLRLRNWLRFYTSHPALVERDFHFGENAKLQGDPALPEPTTGAVQYFCRVCRKVLDEPRIGDVSFYLPLQHFTREWYVPDMRSAAMPSVSGARFGRMPIAGAATRRSQSLPQGGMSASLLPLQMTTLGFCVMALQTVLEVEKASTTTYAVVRGMTSVDYSQA